MATFKGLFGRTLKGKSRKAYVLRSIARARKQREKEEAYKRMQENLERNQQRLSDSV
jgi:hypothetical protein